MGMHPPQPVPAPVHDLIDATSVHPCPLMAEQIVSLVTLLHEHTVAVPGIEPTPTVGAESPIGATSPPSDDGVSRSPRAMAASASYPDASPTRIPPSTRPSTGSTTKRR